MNSELQTLIASVGFPIALSMYLLVRLKESFRLYLIVLMNYLKT
ncbi:YvrJ family protein [uncultured Romboutsia sp.]